ncbi:MAG: acyltransferase [Bacteroidetes bacterium]|nr:acyltransferase [Bacteroidota bacterium]
MENNNLELIGKFAKVGEDVFVSKNVEIKRPETVYIGSHNAIDSGFKCTTKLELGDYIHIAPDVTVIGGQNTYLKLDHFSFIAAGSKIVCGSENYVDGGLVGPTIPTKYRNLIFKPVVFEKYAGVGVNCSIMPGVTLAEGSVVGANSVVTKSTEPWMVYVGSPAKPIRKRDKETVLRYAKELGY